LSQHTSESKPASKHTSCSKQILVLLNPLSGNRCTLERAPPRLLAIVKRLSSIFGWQYQSCSHVCYGIRCPARTRSAPRLRSSPHILVIVKCTSHSKYTSKLTRNSKHTSKHTSYCKQILSTLKPGLWNQVPRSNALRPTSAKLPARPAHGPNPHSYTLHHTPYTLYPHS